MRANGRASGPALHAVFLVVLAHSEFEDEEEGSVTDADPRTVWGREVGRFDPGLVHAPGKNVF